MNKIVYILRGIPGNGKTTLAEQLCDTNKSSVICCADDYFMHNNEYLFDTEKLGSAHKWCQHLFLENLTDETEIIIVANTNTRERDVNVYRKLALEHGYTVFVLTVENWHSGNDVHNVPEETKEKMREQLIKSIKL